MERCRPGQLPLCAAVLAGSDMPGARRCASDTGGTTERRSDLRYLVKRRSDPGGPEETSWPADSPAPFPVVLMSGPTSRGRWALRALGGQLGSSSVYDGAMVSGGWESGAEGRAGGGGSPSQKPSPLTQALRGTGAWLGPATAGHIILLFEGSPARGVLWGSAARFPSQELCLPPPGAWV